MSSRNLIAVALLALAMLVGGGAMVVHAVPGRAAGEDDTAMVDMDRIYNSSDLPQVMAQRANQLAAQAQDRLEALSDARFLEAKELQEYGDLVAKAQPDPVQKARIKELKALSDTRSAELDKLQVKIADTLTPADKARMHALVEMSHLIDRVLPGIQSDLAQDQSDRLRALRREQIAQLRTIVATVAKEKGVAHVFDVNAMVYTANDLTPLVLKKLKPGK
jgi:Skp family chaperone for outer membrane proteins